MCYHIKSIIERDKVLTLVFFVKTIICLIIALLLWKTQIRIFNAIVSIDNFDMFVLPLGSNPYLGIILLTFVGAIIEGLVIFFLEKLKISKRTLLLLFVLMPIWNVELYFFYNFTMSLSILFFVMSIFFLTEIRNKNFLYIGIISYSLSIILNLQLCFLIPIIFAYIYRTRKAEQSIISFLVLLACLVSESIFANIELLNVAEKEISFLQNYEVISLIITLLILIFSYIGCIGLYFHTKCLLSYFLCIGSIGIIIFNPFKISAIIIFSICFIMIFGYITSEKKTLLAILYAFEILIAAIQLYCEAEQYAVQLSCAALAIYFVLCYELYYIITRNDTIFKRGINPFIIGIGGDSGAGKSSLLQLIKQLLTTDESTVFIEGDGDHKWERGDKNWCNYTALNPEANHLYRQAYDIISLRKHASVYRSEYDHQSGKFTEAHKIRNGKYIVLSGLHSLFLPLLRKELDLKVYLDTDEMLQKYWKIKRDKKERGYSIEQILFQLEKRHVDAKEYIYPQKQYASLIIRYFDDTLESFYQENHDEILSVTITLSMENNLEQLIGELNKYGLNVRCEISKDFNWQTVIVNGIYLCGKDIDFEKIAQATIPLYKELFLFEADWQPGIEGIVQLFLAIAIGKKLRSDI